MIQPTLHRKVISQLQAVILAGGLGTRLRPVTEKIPKALVEVNGEPFLHWQLKYLSEQGFKRVLLLCSYLGEQVQKHFGDEYLGMNITYSFEKPEPLGTGGALKHAASKLDKIFFLFNGDSYLEADTYQIWQFFKGPNWMALVSAFSQPDKTVVPANLKMGPNSGVGGSVNEYRKGGGTSASFNAVDSGIYLIDRSIIDSAPQGKFQLEELWPQLIKENKLGAYFVNLPFYDIGTPERVASFEEFLRK